MICSFYAIHLEEQNRIYPTGGEDNRGLAISGARTRMGLG